jgi:repressor of nif and glnA expression
VATVQEQITSLKEALATGTETVTIGDRSIKYRSVDEIRQILAKLEAESVGSSSDYVPFGVLQVNYSRGI